VVVAQQDENEWKNLEEVLADEGEQGYNLAMKKEEEALHVLAVALLQIDSTIAAAVVVDVNAAGFVVDDDEYDEVETGDEDAGVATVVVAVAAVDLVLEGTVVVYL